MAKKINLKPTLDRVVLLPDTAESTTAHGIILPESAQEKPKQGTVVAVGPGPRNDEGEHTPLTIEAGDSVIYGGYSATEIDVDGTTYLLIREADLLAKLD
jgi:chaperonin GroES